MAMCDGVRNLNFKIVLLGEGCVGKTSLVLRYAEDKFSEKHITTLQASFLTKRVNINGRRLNLAIWDTAGQERFHALGPIYYRESHGAVLVYDITSQDSFVKVKNWVKELRKILGDNVCLAIAGNKCDLEDDWHVATSDAEQYASEVGAFHILTSAKLNQGVDELFFELCKQMLDMSIKADEERLNSVSRSANHNRTLQVIDDTEVPTSSSSCCSS